jgi:H+/Cl- antiporter ClcA
MAVHWHPREQVRIALYVGKWTVLASLVGVLAGSASALFLHSLNWATKAREANDWLLYLLPVSGLLIGLFYHYLAPNLEKGNNLLLEEIHRPKSGVPGRLAPVILLATVGTHLFGGSAGREGTAVQMGGSLAASLARLFRLEVTDVRLMLMAGISAGVGSVFGTPLAGMVFGMEVLAMGRIRFDGLIPCLIASVVGNWTCEAWWVVRAKYVVPEVPPLTVWLVVVVLISALAFAMASVVFAELTAGLHGLFKRLMPWAPGRPILGGVTIIALAWVTGGPKSPYLGLSLPLIFGSFEPNGVDLFAFAWKILFTAVTLSSGFKGGEVTPLFLIGAALGCTLGRLFGLPPGFLTALGFVAVFAGAANTPLSSTLMGIELFGHKYGVFLAIVCCGSYIWSGHRGIYPSQRVGTLKATHDEVPDETTMDKARQNLRHGSPDS